MRNAYLFVMVILILLLPESLLAQCPTCGNGVLDGGETNLLCPQDAPHAATCTSPCAQPTSFESTTGIRLAVDFVGTATWTTAGLPAGWTFAGGPSATTAGALPAADAYGAKAGLIQPNCAGSCTATNGFCIGNLASNQAVGAGGANGKLGANFDGRPNVAANLSYAVLRGQSNPTLVSPAYDMSAVNGFKVQFWLFPSETSCGQLNSWGSCVGNVAFLDFSSNNGSTWAQVIQMDLSSSNIDMCSFNSSNTKWLTESSWSRVCLTVFRNTSAAGNFYTTGTATSAASGIMMNSAYFTSQFKYRIRYSQTASCTSGITTTNPGRYLAIDYPTITSGNEMIPCGISFSNLCGYGADNNDDGVGSSTLTSFSTAFGTVRRCVNQAERGVEIFHSQSGTFASQNLSGTSLPSNFDLCNAEGGDKQCIDWQSSNGFYFVAYECITDWEAPSGSTGINVQYYKGTTPTSFGLTKVTAAGKTASLGWRYSGSRFVSCGSSSDLNPGCNGYYFLSATLPTQSARGFYALSANSTGQSWAYFGASSCNNYFNGPFFAPIAIPDTLTGSGNYTICNGSNQLVFTGLSEYCFDASGMTGTGSILVTGPNGFTETIPSGGQGSTPIVDAGTYIVTAQVPSSPAQCLDCGRKACITITATDITDCTTPMAIQGLDFWGSLQADRSALLQWRFAGEAESNSVVLERAGMDGDFRDLAVVDVIRGQNAYQWRDPHTLSGASRYRLRVMGSNGLSLYSDLVEIRLLETTALEIWPNPALDHVQIRIGFMAGQYMASLHDLSGRVVRSWTLESQDAILGLASIVPGIYLLKVRGDGKSCTQRLILE